MPRNTPGGSGGAVKPSRPRKARSVSPYSEAQPSPTNRKTRKITFQYLPGNPLRESVTENGFIDIDLKEVFNENFRGNRYQVPPTNPDDPPYNVDVVNELIWYICFRGLVLLDMVHDFTEERGNLNKRSNEYLNIIFTQNYMEIYFLSQKLFGSENISDDNDFQFLLQTVLFPLFDDNGTRDIGEVDKTIYQMFFVTDERKLLDIYDASFKLLLKCGILRTTVLQQNIQNGIIGYGQTIDIAVYIQENYDRNRKPSLRNPVFTCDTKSQPSKFYLLLPYLNLLNNSHIGRYIHSLANIYDAGPSLSNFKSEFTEGGNRIEFDNRNTAYNIYFTFDTETDGIINGTYRHQFMKLKYTHTSQSTVSLQITKFSLCDTILSPIIGPQYSSVSYLSSEIKSNITDHSKVVLLSAHKFAGDFGKVIYNYNKMKTERNVIIHAVTDIIGGYMSGMFLPGTVLSSFSQARDAGLIDSEFYFKRAFDERNIEIGYPSNYIDLLNHRGLSFGKKTKSVKVKKTRLDKVLSDIKYLCL